MLLLVLLPSFLDMVHGLLQEILAGIHFLLLKTTLQRGGTCEAHGIGTQNRNFGSKKSGQVKCLSKIASWRPLGSILEAPGLDFGGSGAPQSTFWKALGLFLACLLEDL